MDNGDGDESKVEKELQEQAAVATKFLKSIIIGIICMYDTTMDKYVGAEQDIKIFMRIIIVRF